VLLFAVAVSKLRKTKVPTTTIRLPEDLKQRVSRAATSSHAFILEAIAERVAAAPRRDDFYDTAERRYAEIVESGETIPWSRMRSYLADRIAGKQSARPKARKLGR